MLKWVLSRRHSYVQYVSQHSRRPFRKHWRESHMSAMTIHKCCETSAIASKQLGYPSSEARWIHAKNLQATLQQRATEPTERPITQPNMLTRQQALVNAHGHGGHFHVTGGMHLTSDDLFISMEMTIQNEERVQPSRERQEDMTATPSDRGKGSCNTHARKASSIAVCC